MNDYNVKSNVEINFVVTLKKEASDVFSAEATVKETIRSIINDQLKDNFALNSLKDDGTPFLINIKCITKDIKEGIIVHKDE